MLRSPTLRAALAFACLSAWLVLIFSGITLGKTVYLLLVAALVLFPWKWLRKPASTEAQRVEALRVEALRVDALRADPPPIDAE